MCKRNSPEKKKRKKRRKKKTKRNKHGICKRNSPDKIDVIVGCVTETPHIKRKSAWDA